MPDLVALSRTLVALVALPWLCAIFLVLRPVAGRTARLLTSGATALTAGLALAHVLLLATSRRTLFLQHLWSMARVDRFDVDAALTLDLLSGSLLVAVAGFAAVSLFRAPDDALPRLRRARTCALVGTLACALLADNLIVFFFALHGAAFLARGLSRSFPFRAALYGAAAWVLGALFVTLDPGIDPGAPEGSSTLAAIPVAESASGSEPGRLAGLTLTAPSGAVVYTDGLRTPLLGADGEPLRAPFVRAPVPTGVHSFRVRRMDTRPGVDDDMAPHVTIDPGREVILAPSGPAVTFRQLHIRSLVEGAGGFAQAVGALLVFGALLIAAGIADPAWRSVTQGIAVITLAARLGGAGGPTWLWGILVVIALGVAVAGWLLARAGRTVMTTGLQAALERQIEALADQVAGFDHWVLGGIVNAALALVRAAAWIARQVEARWFGVWTERAAGWVVKGVRRIGKGRAAIMLLMIVASAVCGGRAWGAPVPPPPRAHGKIALELPGGGRGPVVLTPKDGGYVGELVVANVGDEPLVVSRLAIRGDADDVRSPPHVSARFSEGAPAAVTLPPGGSAKVSIAWMPERDPRTKQAFGHVLITSTDDTAGDVAMGFRASVPRPMGVVFEHPLSWLVALPIVAAALLLVFRVIGVGEGISRAFALGAAAIECALASWLAYAFVPGLTRADGNDGLQFVDRAPWVRGIGGEYFVGVDGVSVVMVLLIAVITLVGVIAWSGDRPGARPSYDAYLAAAGAMMGVVVAQDVLLFVVFWGATLIPLGSLVGRSGGRANAKLLLFASFGFASLVAAVLVLHAYADRTFLVDGTVVPRGFSIPEWSRVDFSSKPALFGAPPGNVAWVLLFVGFGAAAGLFPLHTWLADVRVGASGPAALLVGGVYTALGAYGLVRLGVGVLPEAAHWAAGTVVAFGAVTVVWGALCAILQRDLARTAAYASMSHVGFAIIGVGALTAQGFTGALTQVFVHGVVAALIVLVLTGLDARVGTTRIDELSGLVRETPRLAVLVSIALLASAAAPGLAGFWGVFLVLLGTFARHPAIAIFALAGATLHAAAHIVALRRLLFGEVRPGGRVHPRLEAFGGKLPDLSPRETAVAAPLVVLVLLLGLWPAPLLSLISVDAFAGARPPTEAHFARTAHVSSSRRPGS